jgi:hypothetical protein
VNNYLEKSIELQDTFGRFNSLININNDKYFVTKTKFTSLTNILESGDVTDPDDGEVFLEIYYNNSKK